MIWILLYPLRGTTNPPVLPPNSYIRLAFQRYGICVARHWLLTIILSVAAAVTLCYPSIFLYSCPASGFNRVPHHVWTSAKLFDSPVAVQPDIEMRQVWIHGNYMQGLVPSVLKEALNIQNELTRAIIVDSANDAKLTSTFTSSSEGSRNAACGLSHTLPPTWGIHSPLMYWDCSRTKIETDLDVLRTINTQLNRKSHLNLTLSSRSVFAGKDFHKQNVTAADALVITLFDLVGSQAGSKWDQKIRAVSEASPRRHRWYFPEGGSQLYEFEFKHMSLHDGMILFMSYTAMAIYVLANLRRTPALKSTLGLAVAIVTELTISVIASFPLCGLRNVELTRIPREVYPFVVLTVGLENMLYLMDEVVATSATLPTAQRISSALGQVGFTSLTVACQNLVVLYLLSLVVAPSVRAFCAFAAIALVLEFGFHLTFFLAVLAVDVQRLELQDSLDKTTWSSDKRSKSPERRGRISWVEALKQGRLPISTRVAGTAVSICFVLGINWHFFDNLTILDMVRSLIGTGSHQSGYVFPSSTHPPINQRMTPRAWMRNQDHQSAQEILQLINLKSSNFAAKIHQPVIVVLDGANRTGTASQPDSLIVVIESVLNEHLIPWSLAVVVIVGLTTILMNYLLWHGTATEIDGESYDTPSNALHIERLHRTHEHDIIKLHCSGRHLVTISSDRSIAMHLWDATNLYYRSFLVRTEYLSDQLWPIVSVAMNDSATWLALLAQDGRVAVCKTSNRRLKEASKLLPQERPPLIFAFKPSLKVVSSLTSKSVRSNGHIINQGQTNLGAVTPVKDEPAYASFPATAAPTARESQTYGQEQFAEQLLSLSTDGFLSNVTLSETISTSAFRIVDDPVTHALTLSEPKAPSRVLVVGKYEGLDLIHEEDLNWSKTQLKSTFHCNDTGHASTSVRAAVAVSTLSVFVLASVKTVKIFDHHSAELVSIVALDRPLKKNSLKILHSTPRECDNCQAVAVSVFALAYTDAENNDFVMVVHRAEAEDPTRCVCFSTEPSRKEHNCLCVDQVVPIIHSVIEPGSWEATEVQAIIGIRRLGSTEESEPEPDLERVSFETSATDVPSIALRNSRVRPRRSSRPARRVPSSYRSQSADVFEDYEIWTMSMTGELNNQPLSCVDIKTPGIALGNGRLTTPAEYDQLFAGSTGPVQSLGKRSIAVVIANAILVISLGNEGRWRNEILEDNHAKPGRGEIGSRRSREKGRRRDD